MNKENYADFLDQRVNHDMSSMNAAVSENDFVAKCGKVIDDQGVVGEKLSNIVDDSAISLTVMKNGINGKSDAILTKIDNENEVNQIVKNGSDFTVIKSTYSKDKGWQKEIQDIDDNLVKTQFEKTVQNLIKSSKSVEGIESSKLINKFLSKESNQNKIIDYISHIKSDHEMVE